MLIPPVLQFTVTILVEPDGDEFHAYCPALKGLHVDGNTEEEAAQHAAMAAGAYLESLIKHREPIPLGIEIAGHPSPGTTTRTERLEVSVPA